MLKHLSNEVLRFTGLGFLDLSRELQDKADIQKLLALPSINLTEVKKYVDLFAELSVIEKLQGVKR